VLQARICWLCAGHIGRVGKQALEQGGKYGVNKDDEETSHAKSPPAFQVAVSVQGGRALRNDGRISLTLRTNASARSGLPAHLRSPR
jgi:hypothetical protein